MEQHIRTIAATILSMLILIGWQYFFVTPELEQQNLEQEFEIHNNDIEELKVHKQTIEDEFKSNTRVKFENDYIAGFINLIGAKIDSLVLKKYKDNENHNVILLSPDFSENPNFLKIDWKLIGSKEKSIDLPNHLTLWEFTQKNNTITLTWINPQGVLFQIDIVQDDMYLFYINTTINTSNANIEVPNNIKIRTHVSMQRSRNASITDSMILHEGPVSVINGKLKEISFSDVEKESYKFSKENNIEWIGFSDKYWLVSFIPQNRQNISASIFSSMSNEWNQKKFSIDLLLSAHSFDEKIITDSFMLFAGAKSIEVLDAYEKTCKITMFDRAVDLGFLYFITKPIFLVLNYFYKMIGNFGLAIMLLTVLTKLLLFPLAYKSVKSMNRIKQLQPKITKLKEQYDGNAMLFQQALVSLYKKEKVNPASGCLPILLQMPIFFALYKVLYVTIEMRHAPFFGWITDLSAPDSTTIFNLFGLIPWQPPTFLMIGVLPILMALTMFVQQMLSPQPTDQTQAIVMRFMPLMLLFMFAQFPSGLLIYWTWSNIISILQQIVIKYLPE